jgi:hypothetical protein
MRQYFDQITKKLIPIGSLATSIRITRIYLLHIGESLVIHKSQYMGRESMLPGLLLQSRKRDSPLPKFER